ncbi:hypothetical protein DRJ19_03425 [Candidatus Woesearchaeota archaeon]|nr:MAG: hypothetical protein DRJ19_03425 [Candidatus Woesearchaeota archaeon]
MQINPNIEDPNLEALLENPSSDLVEAFFNEYKKAKEESEKLCLALRIRRAYDRAHLTNKIEMQKNFDDELKKLLPNSIPHRIYLTIGKITLLASYIRTQIQTYVTELLVGKPQKKFAVY